jgi:SAM-dependent methyltransferase
MSRPATLPPSFSLLADLWRLNRRLTPLKCPVCHADEPVGILRRDRYFLDVRLSICGVCGATYLARGLAGEAASDFYGGIYQRLMRVGEGGTAQIGAQRLAAGYRAHVLRHAIGPLDGILDIGTGLGFFLDACRQSGSLTYHGIEPGAVQRHYAENELGLGGHVDGEGLDSGRRLPFQPRIITLFHVLEHLEDPGALLSLAAGWLPPDGWLVIEVPDASDWEELGLVHVHVSHRSYFTPATLGALLARHGFAVHRSDCEADGIHPGNLRMFARPGRGENIPEPSGDVAALAADSRRRIAAFGLRWGYPRSAIRLLRLAASRSL